MGAQRAALGHQRRKADPLWVFQRLQPAPDHFAVFSRQGHHICHRAEAKQITVFCQQRLPIALERGGKLERHAHARHLQNRLRLVFPVRVDDRDRLPADRTLHSWWSVMTRSMPSSLHNAAS